jgi:hypothetical protein
MIDRSEKRGARRWRVAGIVALVGSLASPVFADCYDILGCTDHDAFSAHYDYLVARDGPTCDFLFTMRNLIYSQHGYCFKTARAVQEIGNQDCHIQDMAAVPLSQIERNNVATIQRAERARNCPA